MKNLFKPRYIPLLALGGGVLGFMLRLWLFATGIDEATLTGLCADHQVVVTLENGVVDGGFGEKIARFYGNCDMRVLVKGLKKEFYDKVPYGELMECNRLTPKQITEDVMAVLGK